MPLLARADSHWADAQKNERDRQSVPGAEPEASSEGPSPRRASRNQAANLETTGDVCGKSVRFISMQYGS